MVPVNDLTMPTRCSKQVSVTGLGDKRDTFFSNKCPFLNSLYTSTVDSVLLTKKDTKKSTIAERVGQITQMIHAETTRSYCCTKPNWIGSSMLWNNRPRSHSLGILACKFAARKNIRGRYFRGKIFSREAMRERDRDKFICNSMSWIQIHTIYI